MTHNIMPSSGMRPIIAIIGNTNSGKSTLLNKIVGQDVAIVSAIKGTTTDSVSKNYELTGFGAVSFFDTAGFDDYSELGEKRLKATKRIINRAELVLVVIGKDGLNETIKAEIEELKKRNIDYVVVYNFSDVRNDIVLKKNEVLVSALTGDNINVLIDLMIKILKKNIKELPLVSDLVKKNDVVVMVTPIDDGAPKGRIILPQVQVLRELLDNNAIVVTCRETELKSTLAKLKNKPDFVIVDSQVIKEVVEILDKDIKVTTFSTLFARNKGDFKKFLEGALFIDKLKDGDKILIAEGCSHRVTCKDIGRVKIPNLVKKYTKKELVFDFVSGLDFRDDLSEYALVIHCGGCMLTRNDVCRRIEKCKSSKVKITNFGILISKIQGVLERVSKDLS